MNRKLALLLFLSIISLGGCGSHAPRRSDIDGTWVSDKGGWLIFYDDGRFRAEGLPADFLFEGGYPKHRTADSILPNDLTVRRVDGTGHWSLAEAPGRWEWLQLWWGVNLDFGPINGKPGYGDTIKYSSQRGGVLEFWEDVDAGDWIAYRRR